VEGAINKNYSMDCSQDICLCV